MSPGAGTPHSDIYAYYIPPVACTPDSDIFSRGTPHFD